MPSIRGASQVASGTAGSFSCNKPTGTAQGDVLVAFHGADVGALTDMGTPTGGATWNLLASRARDDATGAGSKVWWKVAGASEPTSYGFTQGSNADGAVSIVAVQNASSNTPVIAQTGGTTSGTSKATPSTTPNGSDDLEIRCVILHAPGASGLTSTAPATYTEQTDVESGQYVLSTTATKALTSGAATGTQNFTISASVSEWHGFTVDIGSSATAISLTDSATAEDAATVAVDVPVADTASAADSLTAAADLTVTDVATASDDVAVSASVPLADSATADDSVLVSVPISLADSASADDAWSSVPTPVLDEQAAADDAVSVTASAPWADSATATDDLTVSPVSFVTLDDTATASESLAIVVLQDLPFTAGAVRRGWTAGIAPAWSADKPTV